MNYFFYKGTNPEYVRIMRDELKLQPSLKTRAKITQKIDDMSEVQDYCRNDINTELLTDELNAENNVAFYIEDKKQTILGVIVFKIDDAINNTFFDTAPLIRVHAFCTPFSGGNGKKLMNMVIRFGKKIGAETIHLSAAYTAVGFYQKMGFKLEQHHAREYKRIKDFNTGPAPSRVSRRNTSFSFEHATRQETTHNGLRIPPGMDRLPFLNMVFHYASQSKSRKPTMSQRSATIFNTRRVKRSSRRTRSV
jgi:GNAT superfamily N-acetyltransferase